MGATATSSVRASAPVYDDRFRRVVEHVLGIEGGHSNDPVDRGGETKFGISLRFLKVEGLIDLDRNGFADFDLDFDGDIDGADIRALTPDQAISLYRRCFWERHAYGQLLRPIDGAMFDQAVNGGAAAAGKILQRALNRVTGEVRLNARPLVLDGVVGDITRQRLRDVARIGGMSPVIEALRDFAEARYRAIVAADPSQKKYLKGWVRRARSLGDV